MPANYNISRKTKILYVIETLDLGGAEGLLVSTLKYINRDKFCVYLVYLKGESAYSQELKILGITAISLGLRNLNSWFSAICKLCRLIRKERFDIIHTHLFFANVYARFASKICGGGHVLTTLHNPDYSFECNKGIKFRIRKFLDRFSGRICNSGFIAVSEFVKKDFESNLGFKNIKVLYNCVDTAQFKKLSLDDSIRKRKELGLNIDDIVLLNIGRLHPQKNQASLIDALNILAKHNNNYKLIIIGKGCLRNELKVKVDKLGLSQRVIFLEDRTDIAQIISACDIFVFSSVYEGFGIAVVEAMACGKPIVAFDIDALREILRDKIDGMLVEKNNVEVFAKSVMKLENDVSLTEYLGKNAAKRARDMFGTAQYTARLEAIYQEMIANVDKN